MMDRHPNFRDKIRLTWEMVIMKNSLRMLIYINRSGLEKRMVPLDY